MGEVTHTLSPLRDGLTHVDFDCAELTISSARVNGKDTTFELRNDKLRVNLAQPAKAGEKFEVNLQYEGKPTTGLFFILPDKDDPSRPKEIWTQGEAEDTHHYIPIYDYPNDRATSEMILTVPGDWLTVSNGKLLSVQDVAGGGKKGERGWWRAEGRRGEGGSRCRFQRTSFRSLPGSTKRSKIPGEISRSPTTFLEGWKIRLIPRSATRNGCWISSRSGTASHIPGKNTRRRRWTTSLRPAWRM